jgi:ATP-dependent protease ClpP protease subunit
MKLGIDIDGFIDEATAARVIAELEANPKASRIHLHVSSEGGFFASSMAIHEAIRAHAAKVKRAYIADASSGAILVALAADKRIALGDAHIVIHRAERRPDTVTRWTAKAHAAAVSDLNKTDHKQLQVFSRRTGRPMEVFKKEMANEKPSKMGWLLENNIIHEVL